MTTRPSAGDSTTLSPAGDLARRIAEELHDEHERRATRGPRISSSRSTAARRRRRRDGDERPSLAGDDRMRVVVGHAGRLSGDEANYALRAPQAVAALSRFPAAACPAAPRTSIHRVRGRRRPRAPHVIRASRLRGLARCIASAPVRRPYFMSASLARKATMPARAADECRPAALPRCAAHSRLRIVPASRRRWRARSGRDQRHPRRAACAQAFISSARLVHQLVLLDPRHHRAQLLADDLDRVLAHDAAARRQRRRARAVLDDEVLARTRRSGCA